MLSDNPDETSRVSSHSPPSLGSNDDYTYAYALLSLGTTASSDQSAPTSPFPTSKSPPVVAPTTAAPDPRMDRVLPKRENSGKSVSEASYSSQETLPPTSLELRAHSLDSSQPGRKRCLENLQSYSMDSGDALASTKKVVRGKYKCRKCGAPKNNHICVGSDDTFSFSSVYIQTEQASIDLRKDKTIAVRPLARSAHESHV